MKLHVEVADRWLQDTSVYCLLFLLPSRRLCLKLMYRNVFCFWLYSKTRFHHQLFDRKSGKLCFVKMKRVPRALVLNRGPLGSITVASLIFVTKFVQEREAFFHDLRTYACNPLFQHSVANIRRLGNDRFFFCCTV